MGRVFTRSADHTASEPIKKVACPFPKWSAGLFDPDSDEFFRDAVWEMRRDLLVQPPSPVESVSTDSETSGVDSLADTPETIVPLPSDVLRRVQADVESIAWLARVPSDAHVVPDARDVQSDIPPPPVVARLRSISDATNPIRPNNWSYSGRPHIRSASHPEDLGAEEDTHDSRPMTPPLPPPENTTLFSTPTHDVSWTHAQTPAASSYAISPPPSVTPRVLIYEHAARRAYPPVPQSPTLLRAPRAPSVAALPAF